MVPSCPWGNHLYLEGIFFKFTWCYKLCAEVVNFSLLALTRRYVCLFSFFPFLSEHTMRMRRLLAYAETQTGLNPPCHQVVGFCMPLQEPVKNLSTFWGVAPRLQQVLLGLVHTTRKKYENAALFLRSGLPSTLIRHENGAFGERVSNRRNLKYAGFAF